MNQTKMKKAARLIARWRDDPVAFCVDNFGVTPDAWQVEFLEAYQQNNRIAAKACKGPGKTAVLAWCAWHFMVCYPQAQVAATSITGDNLRDGLWKEMAKWQMRSEFIKQCFAWKAERIVCKDHPETWFMSARKWSKDATGDQQANALAGLHADYIMFILDEAGGIPDAVMAAAEAVMANAGTEVNPDAIAKILICGNPTHLSGPLYRACSTEASLWKTIEITGDPDAPNRSPRISKQWAREQIKKYGADNPWVLVNVFGRFPPASLNALIGPDEVEAAMNRVVPIEAYKDDSRILGVDVARHGDDQSVIFPRQGIVAFMPKKVRIQNTQRLASVVAVAMKKWPPDGCFVDSTGGLGYAIIDPLREWGYTVTDVHFAAKATDQHYFNKRSEMIWEMCDWIKRGGCLPRDNELKEELVAMTYYHQGDKLRVVEKDIIKEEIGRSPDTSDALALTFAYPVMRKTEMEREAESMGFRPYAHGNSEAYDPLDQNQVDEYNPFR